MDILNSFESNLSKKNPNLGFNEGRKHNIFDEVFTFDSNNYKELEINGDVFNELSLICNPSQMQDPRNVIEQLSKKYKILNKRAVIIESVTDKKTGDIIIRFHHGYIATLKSDFKQIIKNTSSLYKDWNYSHELTPSELNYSSACKTAGNKKTILSLIYTFITHFDLLVDLSNSKVYKHLNDIQFEDVLKTNYQLSQPIEFDCAILHKAIKEYCKENNFFSNYSRSDIKLEVLSKSTNRFKKIDKDVIFIENNTRHAPYIAEHKLLLIQSKINKYSHLHIFDMKKLQSWTNNENTPISEVILYRESNFLADKLRLKYKEDECTRTCGSEFSTISPPRRKRAA